MPRRWGMDDQSVKRIYCAVYGQRGFVQLGRSALCVGYGGHGLRAAGFVERVAAD